MSPVVLADISSKVVVLLLLVCCSLFLMIIGGFVFGPCSWVGTYCHLWFCGHKDREERAGFKVIKLKFCHILNIKRNDWLLADTCLQAANHCALF